jgi:hypothetical protein
MDIDEWALMRSHGRSDPLAGSPVSRIIIYISYPLDMIWLMASLTKQAYGSILEDKTLVSTAMQY